MTTLNSTAAFDLTEARDLPAEESLWSRIITQLGIIFGRTFEYLNEDMRPVEGEDGNYYFIGGCCCL